MQENLQLLLQLLLVLVYLRTHYTDINSNFNIKPIYNRVNHYRCSSVEIHGTVL